MSFFRLQSKSTKGFTLIEVMIALVILAVGLLALMAMQIVSIKANAFSSEMTYSAMLAEQQLETLKNLSFTDPSLAVAGNPHSQAPVVDGQGGAYSVGWQVADTTANMKTITITVTWQSRRQGAASQTATQQQVTTTMTTMRSQ